jgi:hypothetical protein
MLHEFRLNEKDTSGEKSLTLQEQDVIRDSNEEETASFKSIAQYLEQISDNKREEAIKEYAESCPAEHRFSFFSKVLKYLANPLEACHVFALSLTENEKLAFYDQQMKENQNRYDSSVNPLSLVKTFKAYEDYLKLASSKYRLQQVSSMIRGTLNG